MHRLLPLALLAVAPRAQAHRQHIQGGSLPEKCCPCSENDLDNKNSPGDVPAGAKTVYISNGFQLDALPTITVVVDHTVTKHGPTVYVTKASDPDADKTRAGGRTDGKTAIPNDKPNGVASGTNPTKAVAEDEDNQKPAGEEKSGRKQGSGKNTGESRNPDSASADDEDPSKPAQSSRLGSQPDSLKATPPVIGNKPSKTAVGGSATATGPTEDDLEKPSGDKTHGEVPKKSGTKPHGAKNDGHESNGGDDGHKSNGGDEETDNGTGDKAVGNNTAADGLDNNTTNNEVGGDTDKNGDNHTTDKNVNDNTTDQEADNNSTDKEVDDNATDEDADNNVTDKGADNNAADKDAGDNTTDKKPEINKGDKAGAAESSRKPVAVSGPKSDSRSGTRTTDAPGLARVTAPPQTRTVSVDRYRTVTKTLPGSDDDDESGDNIEIIIININTGSTTCRTQSGKQCQSAESSAQGNDGVDDQDLEDICTSGDEPTSTKTVFNTVYATVRPSLSRASDDAEKGTLASETSSSKSTRTNPTRTNSIRPNSTGTISTGTNSTGTNSTGTNSTANAAPASNSTMIAPDRGSWNGTLWNGTATDSAARPRGSTGFLNRQRQRASLLKRLRGL